VTCALPAPLDNEILHKAIVASDAIRLILKSIALAMAATPGIVSFARSEHRATQALVSQNAKEGVAELERILASAISILFDGEQSNHIRANVMRAIHGRLRMFSSANMEAFLDHQMELSLGQGCAGEAWERALNSPVSEYWKPVYALGKELTTRQLRTRWKRTSEQMGLTSHIL
jgi:hypothetical protein